MYIFYIYTLPLRWRCCARYVYAQYVIIYLFIYYMIFMIFNLDVKQNYFSIQYSSKQSCNISEHIFYGLELMFRNITTLFRTVLYMYLYFSNKTVQNLSIQIQIYLLIKDFEIYLNYRHQKFLNHDMQASTSQYNV